MRAVTAKPASTRAGKAIRQIEEKAAGGGGILILVDRHPEEEAEFIQFETVIEPPPAEAVPTANGEAPHSVESGPHIALDEDAPEAESPAAFEVSLQRKRCQRLLTFMLSSIHLTVTPSLYRRVMYPLLLYNLMLRLFPSIVYPHCQS